jgi:hypothetical protein
MVGVIFRPWTMRRYLSNVTTVMNMGTSPKVAPKLKNLSHCRIIWIKDSSKFQESRRINSPRRLNLTKKISSSPIYSLQ